MGEMRDGFAFLESLRQKDREALPSFSSFVRYLDGKARLRGVPLTGQFELTPLCNFRCRMCYVQMTGSQLPQPVLPPETWKALMPAGGTLGESGGYLLLNAVSAFLWEKLSSPVTREELLSAMLDKYDVEASVAASDLDGVLDRLRQEGLLEEDSSEA